MATTGMHKAKHVLSGNSTALGIHDIIDVSQPLPEKYQNKLFTKVSSSGTEVYDCILYVTNKSDTGLYQMDKTTKMLIRHPLFPIGMSGFGKFIFTAGNKGFLCTDPEYVVGNPTRPSTWVEKQTTWFQSISDCGHDNRRQLMALTEKFNIMMEMFTEMYNAPGMPGYVKAATNFTKLCPIGEPQSLDESPDESENNETPNKKRKLSNSEQS